MNYSYSSNILTNPLFMLLVLADVVLKGITLYKSARKDQRIWFVALLLVNSMGILPIIYLFVNRDISLTSTKTVAKKTVRKGKK